jgi:8-oxo-dGTP diphosphatase
VEAARQGRTGSLPLIRAAGGVVIRDGELVIVHRAKYDDWTLPKGKAEPGESDEDCAIREVEEETGLQCELLEELTTVSYDDPQGRPKQVRYWLMRPVSGELRPTRANEIDDARWVPVTEAANVLSYERDRDVLGYLLPA